MVRQSPERPDWDRLYEIAAGQEGLFTSRQAADAGYSPQLLAHHLKGGRMQRVRRGIYRLKYFPAGEQEELITVWLWSEQAGVLSHETALSLHGLSDVLPESAHLTLPMEARKRRLRVPTGVVLHHADVSASERAWVGSVPVTAPARTLNDCAYDGLSPELLQQAARQALQRGMVTIDQLPDVEIALEPFDGIAA